MQASLKLIVLQELLNKLLFLQKRENPPVIDASSAQAIEIDPSDREISISNHGRSNDTVDRELMSHKFRCET